MTFQSSIVNPHYAGTRHQPRTKQAVYARLPDAPINGSPVPHLTSLYHGNDKGTYGDRSYPGNCGGMLIRDLITYFSPRNVLDPMTGSGTCTDVCKELSLPCTSLDIRYGFDATDPTCYEKQLNGAKFDFIWAHPPYWRQKLYTVNSRDLSRTDSLPEFLEGYASFIRCCADSLQPNGKFAILMGDYNDKSGFVPLVHYTKELAFKAGLRQHCTDIIRFSHGASSSRKVYRSSFIPGLHDVCMIFEKIPQ